MISFLVFYVPYLKLKLYCIVGSMYGMCIIYMVYGNMVIVYMYI